MFLFINLYFRTSIAWLFSIKDRAFSKGRTATSSRRNGPYLFRSTPINCSIGSRNLITIYFERTRFDIDSSTFGLPLVIASSISFLLLSDSFSASKMYFSSSVSFE